LINSGGTPWSTQYFYLLAQKYISENMKGTSNPLQNFMF